MTVSRLVAQAEQCARDGLHDDAERTWSKVLDLDRQHTRALTALGNYALERGDAKLALEWLERARLTAPMDPNVLMALAPARGAAGDDDGELEAIQWALAVDPGFMVALLLKGAWYERHGDAAKARAAYSRALENAPPSALWPKQYRRDLKHAQAFVKGFTRAFHGFLDKEMALASDGAPLFEGGRWQEAASICAGRSRPFVSHSHRLHVPRLPAIPFFDTGQFPFLDELVANTQAIREEVTAVMHQHDDLFEPLIAIERGEPVEQWEQLNHSTRLTAMHLWKDASAIERNQVLCPETVRLLGELPLCELAGTSPNAYFSVLAPSTQVPPHHGESNVRATVYLPLAVTGEYLLRVGFEERRLAPGELLIFDDTIEHEASNSSNEPCVILVFDLWNPLLDATDRSMIDTLHRAARSFPEAS